MFFSGLQNCDTQSWEIQNHDIRVVIIIFYSMAETVKLPQVIYGLYFFFIAVRSWG